MEAGYYFIKTVWYYSKDGDDCNERIVERHGPITLTQATVNMKAWLEQHPFTKPEEGLVVHGGMCVMECCDDVIDGEQQSARIEWIF